MSEQIEYQSDKQKRAQSKLSRIPVKIEKITNTQRKRLPKEYYIQLPKASASGSHALADVKSLLRRNKLVTVCEEASCPNLSECFSKGTATFMIMGDQCTRRCSFCDIGHGRPAPLDPMEPSNLADAVAKLKLKYVVITSVDRDDLKDGGAQHFADCIRVVRQKNPGIKVEVLVPDFRGRLDKALDILTQQPPDVFNHNLETAPSLYRQARPGSDYQHSLDLLKAFKQACPNVLTKSGLMLGLGEKTQEIKTVLEDLKAHHVDMITIGQYLQPTNYHMSVDRYVSPQEFKDLADFGNALGFAHVASGPKVRSSYHADLQAETLV